MVQYFSQLQSLSALPQTLQRTGPCMTASKATVAERAERGKKRVRACAQSGICAEPPGEWRVSFR